MIQRCYRENICLIQRYMQKNNLCFSIVGKTDMLFGRDYELFFDFVSDEPP